MARWAPAEARIECTYSSLQAVPQRQSFSSKGVKQAVSEMHTALQDENRANGKWQPALLQLQLQSAYGNLAKMKLSSPTRLWNCGKLCLSAQTSKWTWQQICFLVTTGIRYISSAIFYRDHLIRIISETETVTTFHSTPSKKKSSPKQLQCSAAYNSLISATTTNQQ